MKSKTEVRAARRGEVTKRMQDLLADVYSEMDELKDELQSWRDNLPDNLQDGEKAGELDDTVTAIEEIEEIECPTALEDKEVTWVESTKKRKSRSARRDECTKALSAAIDTVRALNDDGQYDQFLDTMEEAMEQYESIDFPGMH